MKTLIEGYIFEYEVNVDPFTKNKTLVWKNVATKGSYPNDPFFSLTPGYPDPRYLFLEFAGGQIGENTVGFVTYTQPRFACDKGDIIKFLFSDDSIYEIYVSQSVDETTAISKWTKEDYEAVLSKEITHIRYEGKDGSVTYCLKKSYDGNADMLLKEYIKLFLKIMSEELDWEPVSKDAQEILNAISESKVADSEKGCFVYLMLDKNTGFYKIGISNDPQYRERTLQSEKPTIEMICNKCYPTRVIAVAIESALHNAFSDKRVRGEWFALNETEVEQIIQTLS